MTAEARSGHRRAGANNYIDATAGWQRRQDASEEWFANLTANLEKQREAALKAVKAAEKAYSSFRSNVNGAQALAIETSKWDKDWHKSTVSEADLNRPIEGMRNAVGFLESEDDFANGRFLTEEYEGIPPHTMAKLKRGAEIAQPASFAQSCRSRSCFICDLARA